MIVMRPTEAELQLAVSVGALRTVYAIRTNRERGRDALNKGDNAGEKQHVLGAIGEQMLAKHLNVFWSGTIGTVNAVADVDGCYQVRATALPHGKLIVHREKDRGDQPFVLARVLLPDVHLVGWLWGYEAKSEKFWREDVPEAAFFAWPLRDMETLPDKAAILARQLDRAG